MTTRPDMSVTIAGVTFKNPVMTASGTFGSGMEYGQFVDLNDLGAVVTKGVSSVPWAGNPTPRVAEVYGGMLNAIGLQNPGIDVFIERDLAFLKNYDTRVIVNVCGRTEEEYLEVVRRLQDQPVDMLEINVSCPNVKEDAISLINTITGMKIDIEKQTFVLANKTGGMSGPAIKPVAVRMVYQAAQAVSIPIIGMGGIACAEDAIEFMLAGASAVAAGAMNFHNPYLTGDLVRGMEDYLIRHGIGAVRDLTGAVHA